MSVWLCEPSARPPAECEPVFQKWKAQGYNLAIQRDPGQLYDSPSVDMMFERPYAGYPEAVNWLAKTVLRDSAVDFVVCAGDDTIPDLNHGAEEIATSLKHAFYLRHADKYVADWKANGHYGSSICPKWMETFGCCQPTGDRWSDSLGVIIERIAGSPWLGREWCLRANQGRGPLWPAYWHNWADEHLQLTAQKYGCFWQRPDLMHYHDHAMRKTGGKW